MKEITQEEYIKLLKKYEEAYYKGEPKISDEEYDILKAKYESKYGEYEYVPSEGNNTGFNKVKHIYPLLSLDKIQITEKDKLRKELERLWPVVIQPKFDGLSIEIQSNGRFITRGDGHIGDDVTEQCMQIANIDIITDMLEESEEIESLRAEIIMTHQAFKELNKEREEKGIELYSNPRNAAAGMLRNKDITKIKGLTVVIYEELGSICNESDDIYNIEQLIGEDDLEYIEETIRITPMYKPKDIEAAISFLENLEGYRKIIDYDIDGWVVKSDIDNSLEYHGGMTGHHPKNAFAVKGEAKGTWTKIKSITWQVGKENITPVAELEPVEIEGSIISRATLHNVSFLKAMGLDYIVTINGQTLVKVVKANDVIPKIIEIKHETIEKESISMETSYPKKCPVCNQPTAIKESDSDSEILICTNEDCSAKLKARIEHMASREALNIVGMSESTIDKIMDIYNITKSTDILFLRKEHILKLEGFAEKSAVNLEKAILKAIDNVTIDKVLYASSIPLIGRTASKDICKYYSIDELSIILDKEDEQAIKDICKVKGIGKESAKLLIKYKNRFGELFACINNVIDIKTNNNKSNKDQLVFCITGQREPYKTIIEEAGHKVTNSISKKTKALISADGDLTSSKAKKAIELNIPIIKTEEELKELI